MIKDYYIGIKLGCDIFLSGFIATQEVDSQLHDSSFFKYFTLVHRTSPMEDICKSRYSDALEIHHVVSTMNVTFYFKIFELF